jgi:NADPH-dependent 2,4-dienoyl-CoA reductase/sulfur reductase-like enzyme/rhodanese-related sulfurtransferase
MKILIVGGVAGGASAAARARRVNANAEIMILEKGPFISFANCGLPYHVGGEIAERSKLLVATPELFWNRFRIEVRTHHEVLSINRDAKTVSVFDHSQGQPLELTYDRLILSTGSEPIVPAQLSPLPLNAFHLWTLNDMDRIMSRMAQFSPKHAVVIGGGFVGLEVVEQLHRRGLAVTLVERDPQVLKPLERLFARMVEQHMESKGIQLQLGVQIQGVQRIDDRANAIELTSGTVIPADLIIVGAGVRPRIQLAEQAGLPIGVNGGVVVNAWMQTADPAIYAVGDIVELRHGVTGQLTRIPLAGPANRSGRIAGEHAASDRSAPMGPILGTSIVRVFDITAACTGLNEFALLAKGLSFRTAIIQAASHASYFPGAQSMQLKLLYSREDGKILGAQAVGGEGVDKRIDVIATAMHFGATVRQLAQLDLAYAPPYGSAKDPVHMAAFTACNDLDASPKLIFPNENLKDKQVVDVRTARERQQLPLPGAIAIEIDQFPERWMELDPNRSTIVVCHSGKRAHIGACWLRSKGFADVSNLTGGMSIRALANMDA